MESCLLAPTTEKGVHPPQLYRIALADDHVLLRQGVRMIIEEDKSIKVVGEAGDGLELLALLKNTLPDMVILDISMPNLHGIEAIGQIKATYPEVKVLMLTMHNEIEYLRGAMSAGADGYLLKEDADIELFSAIERIRRGKIYVSPSLGDDVVTDWTMSIRKDCRTFAGLDALTFREKQVLKLIAEGKTSREAAGLLSISTRTVEHHRANIMNKLSLKKSAELVKYAVQNSYR